MHKPGLLLTTFLMATSLQASILPENNYTIPVSEKNEGLSEAQYNAVIDKVEAIYRPIIEDNGYSLTVNRLWSDPRVNAGTTKKGTEWILNMYGGYARHSLVTEDGYALVMCHELGHHLGGTPRKVFDSGETAWPSVEGQADYFATLKCLRKIFRKDNNEAVIAALDVPAVIRDKCSKNFKESWEAAICIRTSLAGISIGAISAAIRNTTAPSVDTPDESVVEKTYEAHPLPQCRLDTYFQGSICAVSSARSVSGKSETTGVCHPTLGHLEGNRPLCWYKSSK